MPRSIGLPSRLEASRWRSSAISLATNAKRWGGMDLLRTAMRQPSPAKHIGLDPNTGRDAVPRTVRPPTGKREHVGAVVIFTKQFDRFSGWRFTQIKVVHTLLSGYHYELNT